MKRISGDMAEIESKITKLSDSDSDSELNESVWVEVTYTGSEAIRDIRERLDEILKACPNVEVLNIIDDGKYSTASLNTEVSEPQTLADIEPVKMFQSVLDKSKKVAGDEDKKERLMRLYKEILNNIETGALY